MWVERTESHPGLVASRRHVVHDCARLRTQLLDLPPPRLPDHLQRHGCPQPRRGAGDGRSRGNNPAECPGVRQSGVGAEPKGASMRVIPIGDPQDPLLRDYRDLTDIALRRVLEPEGGLYIAESAKVIARALGPGTGRDQVLVQEKWLSDVEPLLPDDTPVFVVAPEVAEALTGYAVHRGALAARCIALRSRPLRTSSQTLGSSSCWRTWSTTRTSARCFRAAAGLGADAVLVTPRCADPLYRRSVRVSIGAFSVNRARNLEDGAHAHRGRADRRSGATSTASAPRPAAARKIAPTLCGRRCPRARRRAGRLR